MQKYQRHLIPYFKGNLLNEANREKEKIDIKKMKNQLYTALSQPRQSKIDKRLLKCIELKKDEDLLYQKGSIIIDQERIHSRDNISIRTVKIEGRKGSKIEYENSLINSYSSASIKDNNFVTSIDQMSDLFDDKNMQNRKRYQRYDTFSK
ncbi:UNKNOWN [Stylonychia lemnae]|uniref:Uncharacterized protein n=1 Tax=Stylonychia lemnae TaxID=5949 RepID=A0A078B7G6_STYLE|nr:UNKNOWN [Stylonychia lemnae]|eukprot:CDW90161.1 UNKNOWN [Stylonychia lemnae]